MTSLIRTLRRGAAGAVSGVDALVAATATRLVTAARASGRDHATATRSHARALADGRTARPALSPALSLADATTRSVRTLGSRVRAVAFWLGVALPFVHVPLLLAVGLSGGTARTLVALWLLHATALLIGSRHRPGGT